MNFLDVRPSEGGQALQITARLLLRQATPEQSGRRAAHRGSTPRGARRRYRSARGESPAMAPV